MACLTQTLQACILCQEATAYLWHEVSLTEAL